MHGDPPSGPSFWYESRSSSSKHSLPPLLVFTLSLVSSTKSAVGAECAFFRSFPPRRWLSSRFARSLNLQVVLASLRPTSPSTGISFGLSLPRCFFTLEGWSPTRSSFLPRTENPLCGLFRFFCPHFLVVPGTSPSHSGGAESSFLSCLSQHRCFFSVRWVDSFRGIEGSTTCPFWLLNVVAATAHVLASPRWPVS